MQTPGQTWSIDITKCRRQPRRRLTFPHKLFVRFLLSHDGRPVRDARFFYCYSFINPYLLRSLLLIQHNDNYYNTSYFDELGTLYQPLSFSDVVLLR